MELQLLKYYSVYAHSNRKGEWGFEYGERSCVLYTPPREEVPAGEECGGKLLQGLKVNKI
jgi:hypothetical protein